MPAVSADSLPGFDDLDLPPAMPSSQLQEAVPLPSGLYEKNLAPLGTDIEAAQKAIQRLDGMDTPPGVQNPDLTALNNQTGSLPAPRAYQQYVQHAAQLSVDLLNIRNRMDRSDWTLTLQQLGALSQQVALERNALKAGFQHGEEAYYSFRLMDEAISGLEEAIGYWQITNRFRRVHRATVIEKAEDDEVLMRKLQTAFSRIDALEKVQKTRSGLNKLDGEYYPR
ncbi:MAG: hypothetical protein AB7P76_06550 [Candidatus Melainabacteria bacterium]